MSIHLLTSEAKILMSLLHGPKTIPEIIRETSLARTVVYVNVKELLIQGYIEEANNTNRAKKYRITKKGKELLMKLKQEIETTVMV